MKYGDVVMPARRWVQQFDGSWASRPWRKGERHGAHEAILQALDPGPKARSQAYYELLEMENVGEYREHDLYARDGWAKFERTNHFVARQGCSVKFALSGNVEMKELSYLVLQAIDKEYGEEA